MSGVHFNKNQKLSDKGVFFNLNIKSFIPVNHYLLIALFSGAAALIYESIWLRWFQILFGSTAYAASVTLAAFFAGLSIGAIVFGRVSQRTTCCLTVYAWLEIAVVVTALITPFTVDAYDALYPFLYERLSGQREVFLGVKFLLAFLAMLPTAILLGGTLPLIVQAYLHNKETLGKHGNQLYAVNTLGAAAGTALGALWLPDILGVQLTYITGMLLSLVAALMAFFLAAKPSAKMLIKDEAAAEKASSYLLVIAAASGLGTLALEVLLMHSLSQLFDNSVYSFGAILIVVLCSLALAAAFVSRTAGKVSMATMLRAVLILEAVILLSLPWLMSQLMTRFGAFQATLGNGLLIALLLGGPALFIGGMVFPLTFRLAGKGAAGKRMGNLLAVNTLGGIVGSTVAGFILLENIGLWWSLALLGIAYGFAAILVGGRRITQISAGVAVAVTYGVVMVSPMNPDLLPVISTTEDEIIIDSVFGPHGVVSVINRPISNDYRLKINNHYTLSGSGAKVLAERAGHLPLVLHPSPGTVAYIGSATGITAGAARMHNIDKVELIELVPEVQQMARRHFSDYNRDIYNDSRTEAVVEDGRNHIRATKEKYDVVVADLFVPWRPGVGSMYSLEHFQSVKEHLADGGIFCQWLPIFQLRKQELDMVLATFHQVFPDATLWRANFSARFPRLAVIGRNGKWPNASKVEKRTRELSQVVDDRWVTDPEAIWMLYMGSLKAAIDIQQDIVLNTDNHPAFEYLAGRSSQSEREEFLKSGWLDFGDRIQQADNRIANWPLWGISAGQLYALADAQFSKDQKKGALYRTTEQNNLLKKLRKLVPANILVTDPTVAEIGF